VTVALRWLELEDDMHFSGKIVIAGGSFTHVQVLSFGSMHYIIDHNVSFTLLRETSSEDSESPTSCPPAGPPRSQFGGFNSS
jgi:hypothetical protein